MGRGCNGEKTSVEGIFWGECILLDRDSEAVREGEEILLLVTERF